MSITILAIETSCDDTSISILKENNGCFELLTNEVSSQTKLHAQWGGVVPNLAAREHKKNIFPLLDRVLTISGLSPSDIDLIAITQGPGLIPALLVGTSVAKTLAYLWDKPLIGIHHVEGHIYANFIGEIANLKFGIENKIQNSSSVFPALCLVVSGGHTQLVFMRDHFKYEIIGQTLDDAAGEAFDKVARILDIGYPGGPAVSKYAAMYKQKANEATEYGLKFPRPMLNKSNFDFSFSGLKTAVLYETKKHPDLLKEKTYIVEVCHEFQQAVVDVLMQKTIEAAKKYQPKTIMLAGGVSANKELRKQLGEAIEGILRDPSTQSHPSYITPGLTLTGDNAAMIAAAAFFRWKMMSATQKKAAKDNWKTLIPDANLKLR
jgi:N6-L-threonylcarbamoyladenine synthase